MYRELYRKQTRKDKEKRRLFAFRAAENYRFKYRQCAEGQVLLFLRALISIRIPLCFATCGDGATL